MDDAELSADDIDVSTEDESGSQDYQTLAHGVLSPRHRRLAQLAAEGCSNASIAEQLGYSGSRVSILLKNSFIMTEILRLQERIFEETIQQRMKTFAEPALANVHMILTDRTNKVKVSEKAEMSKWVIEKLDGKATQKTDIGENLLAVLMDRLDSQKTQRNVHQVIEMEAKQITASPPGVPESAKQTQTEEDDPLEAWVRDFDTTR